MIDLLQALLTPLIAVLTTLIAYQQYRLRRDEKALIMYDRRLKVYNQVVSVLHKVRASQPMCMQDALDWTHSLTEADFLFGTEVRELISEIYGSLLEWVRLTEPYKIRGEEMRFEVDEWSLKCVDVVDDFESFAYPIEQVFSPYLHPDGASIWKRRKSLKKLKKILKEVGLDEESKTQEDEKRLRAKGIDPNQEITF